MTFPTGCRNVGFCNRRLCVRGRQNIVAVVTVRADSRTRVAAGHRFRVHALSIRQKWPVTNTAALHHRLVPVTAAAGLGDIRAIDCRFRIAGGQDGRQVTVSGVAIKTGCALRSVMNRLSVKSAIIGRVRSAVKKRTSQVGKRLARRMAALALKRRRRGRSGRIGATDYTSGIRCYGW